MTAKTCRLEKKKKKNLKWNIIQLYFVMLILNKKCCLPEFRIKGISMMEKWSPVFFSFFLIQTVPLFYDDSDAKPLLQVCERKKKTTKKPIA